MANKKGKNIFFLILNVVYNVFDIIVLVKMFKIFFLNKNENFFW